MQQRVGLAATTSGQHPCVHDQRGIPVRLHGPAHDTPGEQVRDHRDRQPAHGCPDAGEVGQLSPGRRLRSNLPRGHFRFGRSASKLRSRMVSAIIERSPSSFGFPRRLGRARPRARRAIDAVAGLEALVDGDNELRVVGCPVADRSPEPGVKARPRDARHLAHPPDPAARQAMQASPRGAGCGGASRRKRMSCRFPREAGSRLSQDVTLELGDLLLRVAISASSAR
ncbi:hypothetical protein PAM7066_03736 [Palleronia marisminoris]|uniref:Uncharacterized protein n=1 Tax=Palleronia marisminoris TaxID=315423 RepID=A0A1Y5TV75_9RHOB|nr:hypothetical protein PAM7066_03736 [Palleronia marisminoris]